MAARAGGNWPATAVAFCWLAAATSFTPLRLDTWASSCLQEFVSRGVLRGVGHLCVLSAFVVALCIVAEALARSGAALWLLAPQSERRPSAKGKARRRHRMRPRADKQAAAQPRAVAPDLVAVAELDVLSCLPLKRIPGAVEKVADVEMPQPASRLVDALLGRFAADPSAGGSFLSLLQRAVSLLPAGGPRSWLAESAPAAEFGVVCEAARPPQRLQLVRRVFRSGWQDVSAMLKPFISGESFLELQEVIVVDRAANVRHKLHSLTRNGRSQRRIQNAGPCSVVESGYARPRQPAQPPRATCPRASVPPLSLPEPRPELPGSSVGCIPPPPNPTFPPAPLLSLQVAVSRVRNGNFRWLLEYEARMTVRPRGAGAALGFQFSAAPISFMGSLVSLRRAVMVACHRAAGRELTFVRQCPCRCARACARVFAGPMHAAAQLPPTCLSLACVLLVWGLQLTRSLSGDGGEVPLVDLAKQDLIDAVHMAAARGGAAGADAVDVEWRAEGGRMGELPALGAVVPRGFRAV